MLKSIFSGAAAAVLLAAGSASAQAYDTAITLTGTPQPAQPGDNVTFTFRVTNAGPGDATDASVGLTMMLPLTFVSLSSPAGYSCATPAVGVSSHIMCSRPIIPAGADDTFTAVYNIPFGTSTPRVAYAFAGVSDSFTQDVNMANNEAEHGVQIGTPVSAPSITSLSASSGSTAGGFSLTINGADLGAATSVTFGGAPATITANTATAITVTVPAGVAGPVDVVVMTAGGSSPNTAADNFVYVAPEPVPTLSEWAMILLGLTLAGGAALSLGRPRSAV